MGERIKNAGHAGRYYRAKGAEMVTDVVLKLAESLPAGRGAGHVANRAANAAMAAELRAWGSWASRLDPNRL